jgi:peptidoglycan lytic transglycosylase
VSAQPSRSRQRTARTASGAVRAPDRHGGQRASGGVSRRRRLLGVVGAIAMVVVLITWVAPRLNHAVRDLTLPLRDQDIIRQQAAAKHLDPALIAAVIFAETKFRPRTSSTGAEGLMQIEPATARFLAHLSGGYAFRISDLATPAINVAYGSYYLRYLLDHYNGDEMLALAAYNGGMANVDRWLGRAKASRRQLTVPAIPFPETRAYVQRVLDAQSDYRQDYPQQLGLR